MQVVELRDLQKVLLDEHPPTPLITKGPAREPKDLPASTQGGDATVLMSLAAVAVAIAWWTYRGKAAPAPNLRRVFDCVADGHSYLLPIPRSHPCFCGGGGLFKNCHGRPPNATPSMCAEPAVVQLAG